MSDKFKKRGFMSGWIAAARGSVRIAVGRASFDAGVVAVRSKGNSFFANFSHQPPMERPRATRGGKKKPFREACG